MTVRKTVQATVIALCVASAASSASAASRHHAVRHHASRGCVRTVDVAAIPLPPLPTTDHVCVVNSAEHPIRHRGVVGIVERAHRAHMRVRASIYRTFLSAHRSGRGSAGRSRRGRLRPPPSSFE
jgi:hypothetical protein